MRTLLSSAGSLQRRGLRWHARNWRPRQQAVPRAAPPLDPSPHWDQVRPWRAMPAARSCGSGSLTCTVRLLSAPLCTFFLAGPKRPLRRRHCRKTWCGPAPRRALSSLGRAIYGYIGTALVTPLNAQLIASCVEQAPYRHALLAPGSLLNMYLVAQARWSTVLYGLPYRMVYITNTALHASKQPTAHMALCQRCPGFGYICLLYHVCLTWPFYTCPLMPRVPNMALLYLH